MSAVTNPKALLFFAAFLPQFIDPARGLMLQFVVMASTAQRLRPWLAHVGRRFNQTCGGIFIAIGAMLPLRA